MKEFALYIMHTVIVSFLLIVSIYAETNQINKLFYHQLSTVNEPAVQDIELGKLVLYCTKNPLMQVLSHDQASSVSGYKQSVFLLPRAVIQSSDVERLMARMKQETKLPYRFTIQAVTKPLEGVKVVFDYYPTKVSVAYDVFDSIQAQKGIEFRLYNKLILDRLQKKENCVLKTAHNKTIVIDCGHGGQDVGAVGCFNIKEKDITLSLGLQLADELEKIGYRVVLTRNDDSDVQLDERTCLINKISDARLVVSLHANYSTRACSNGIETFSLDSGLFKDICNPLSSVVGDTVSNKYNQGKLLAHSIHGQVIKFAQKKNSCLIDRRVKHKVAQILLGCRVPAALVEVGFISNEHEARLLIDHEYQRLIVQGLCTGINNYCTL